ncbi:prolyl aminopeptidase [Rickettsiales bacterium]|nr:prolyl aminopeptidase [Rickettsiales bacterium]
MKNKNFYTHLTLPEMYHLDTGDGNKLYIEVNGKKNGIPVIFLHGGPGGHCRSEHHSLFDPSIFKSIIFDQRGCGKSKPERNLENNDTAHLVSDIELIRNFLKIKKFLLVGGSWGATLALCYAQKYPKNILGIVLRSVFLGTMKEIDWAFKDGPKTFAPELYKQFLSFLDEREKIDPIKAYIKKIHSSETQIYSWVWHDYERILSQINPDSHNFEKIDSIKKRHGLPNSPFMETHYIKNRFFMEDDQIINNANKLKNIPGYIVQGRYDLICPPINAYRLRESWETSKIKLVNTAGHSSSDQGIMENLSIALREIISY